MKNLVIVLSIILICVGLVAFSLHNVPQENVIDEGFEQVEDQWQISRSGFRKGENLSVGFNPGYDWGWPPHDNTEIDGVAFNDVKVFYVKVTDPVTENYTEFAVFLIVPSASPFASSGITAHPKIKVTHQGALTVENYTEAQIGGIVQHDGTYVVETSLYPPYVENVTPDNKTQLQDPQPPPQLRLYRLIPETTYPYESLLALGPATMFVGVATLVWSVQRNKNKAVHRKNPIVDVKKPAKRAE
jgi:hypothetical protein